MSSEETGLKLKPGFGLYLAIGAAIAGSAVAAVLVPVFIAIAMSIIKLFKTGSASSEIDFPFLTGAFYAGFTFVFSLIPNYLGMCAVMYAALSRKTGPLYYSKNDFSMAGALYGILILVLSVCLMETSFKKGLIEGLFNSFIFLWLLPAAAFSGILNFQIAAAKIRRALFENSQVKIDDK